MIMELIPWVGFIGIVIFLLLISGIFYLFKKK